MVLLFDATFHDSDMQVVRCQCHRECACMCVSLLCSQLPKYKRDIRSVLTASYDDIVWGFGGVSSLRIVLRSMHIEIAIIPSVRHHGTGPGVDTAGKGLSKEAIMLMTESGRRILEETRPRERKSSPLDHVDFESAPPALQCQFIHRNLKEQV